MFHIMLIFNIFCIIIVTIYINQERKKTEIYLKLLVVSIWFNVQKKSNYIKLLHNFCLIRICRNLEPIINDDNKVLPVIMIFKCI